MVVFANSSTMRLNGNSSNPLQGTLLAQRTVAQLGGTARYAELIQAGVTEIALRNALREGTLVRPHRGTYVVPGIAKHDALAEVFRATVTCVSRCQAFELPLLQDHPRAHLVVPRDRSLSRQSGRPVSQVLLHRRDDIDAEYAASAIGAIDVAGLCVQAREHLALVDCAVHKGLITAAMLERMHVSTPERCAFLATYLDGRAESISETFARLGLVQAGIHLEPQRSLIPGTRTDLVVEDLIALEVDSKKHHSDWAKQRADRDRDRQLSVLGYVPMRVTFEDAVYSVDEVVADVKAVLWRNGVRTDRRGRSASVGLV